MTRESYYHGGQAAQSPLRTRAAGWSSSKSEGEKNISLPITQEERTQKYAIQANNHPSPPHKLPLQSYLVEPGLTLLSHLQLQRALAKPGSDDNAALSARCSTVTEKSPSTGVPHPFFY